MQRALLKEIDLRAAEISSLPIETIYLGGGTPSLWTPHDIEALFSKITSINDQIQLKEVTIECNPDDLSTPYLLDLKRHTPVRRISIGIQSFHDDDLRVMNRSHDALEARKALDRIFQVGFEAVSADLIFGLPGSTLEKWQTNLSTMLEYPIDHISCYNLTIEERTAIHYMLRKGLLELPDDQTALDQYYAAREYLMDSGYIHYEISNYALPGRMAVHNTNYWKNKPYIGIGPSAHSYDGFRRRWNVADNRKYVSALDSHDVFWETENLSEADRYNEYLMTGLRTMWGIETSVVETFNEEIQQEFYQALRHGLDQGFLTQKGENVTLSLSGQALADQIIADFFYVD